MCFLHVLPLQTAQDALMSVPLDVFLRILLTSPAGSKFQNLTISILSEQHKQHNGVLGNVDHLAGDDDDGALGPWDCVDHLRRESPRRNRAVQF